MVLKTRLVRYRSAIADHLQKTIPELRDVQPHAGAFGIDAVKQFSSLSPCAKVVFLRMKPIKRNNIGHLIGPAVMGVYLITKDPMRNHGFAPVLDLAERVADVVELNTWGLNEFCAAARVHEIEPIYSEEIDKIGCAVAGVIFTQEVSIGRDRHAEDEAAEHLYSFGGVPKTLQGRMVGEDYSGFDFLENED